MRVASLKPRIRRGDAHSVVIEQLLELVSQGSNFAALVHSHHIVALLLAVYGSLGRIHLGPVTERRLELKRTGRIAGNEWWHQQAPARDRRNCFGGSDCRVRCRSLTKVMTDQNWSLTQIAGHDPDSAPWVGEADDPDGRNRLTLRSAETVLPSKSHRRAAINSPASRCPASFQWLIPNFVLAKPCRNT